MRRYEQKQLKLKISNLEKNIIPKLVQKRDNNSNLLNCGENVSLIKQRNLRLKIVSKKNKLNCLKQKLSNVTYQIENKKLKLCFGTKDLLKKIIRSLKRNEIVNYLLLVVNPSQDVINNYNLFLILKIINLK